MKRIYECRSRCPQRLSNAVHKVKLLNDRVVISCAFRGRLWDPLFNELLSSVPRFFQVSSRRPRDRRAQRCGGRARVDCGTTTPARTRTNLNGPAVQSVVRKHVSPTAELLTQSIVPVCYGKDDGKTRLVRPWNVNESDRCPRAVRRSRGMRSDVPPDGWASRSVHDRRVVRLRRRRVLHRARNQRRPDRPVRKGQPVRARTRQARKVLSGPIGPTGPDRTTGRRLHLPR